MGLRWNGNNAAMREHYEALAAHPPALKKKPLKKRARKKARRQKPLPSRYVGNYRDYLQSAWWKFKRAQKLQSVRWKCERCGKRATQVHHKHYDTLGRERHSHLEAICGPCHEREHESWIAANKHLDAIAME